MKKTTIIRLCTVCLAAALLVSPIGSIGATFADEISDLQNEYEELKKEQQRLQNEIDKQKQEISQQKEVRKKIEQQITIIQQQIDLLNGQIDVMESNIEAKEIEIVNKQMEVDDNYLKFERRLRADQVSGSASGWELLFGAKSFSEFLSAFETVKLLATYDQELISELREDKLALEAQRESLDKELAALENVKNEADEKRDELDSQYLQVQDEIQDLQRLEAAYKEDKAQVEKDMKETQAEIDRIYAENQSKGEYVGGEFTWPVPELSKITSPYGPRTIGSYSDFHTGIDIAGTGAYGKTIVAANAGTVIFTQINYTPGKGYGKYIIIDHGGGMSTLYGHCSSLLVSTGDVVQKGQAIAKIGSTGFSTGPHLHFEIREDGVHKNPMNWFTKT